MKRRDVDVERITFEVQNNTLAENVFGAEFIKEGSHLRGKQPSSSSVIDQVDRWIQTKLGQLESQYHDVENVDTRPGRLGPAKVVFDQATRSSGGLFVMSDDLLRVSSQANFSTIKANVCLYSGKWYYELQLETKGVMQLGWGMGDMRKFTPEIGVGDTIDSYSYDGNRTRKWNVATSEYGEPWLNGDIIGCAIDLDIGSIHFYRNGKCMGEAFSKIQMGPGCAYFPTISLALNESVVANFGGTPYKYPVNGFAPLQMPPTSPMIRASLILTWFRRLLELSEDKHYNLGKVNRKDLNSFLVESSILVFARLLMWRLAPLLDNYVIEACLIPFLSNLASISYIVEKKEIPVADFKMKVFCEILIIFLTEDDLNMLMRIITREVVLRFKQVSSNVDFIDQKRALALLISMTGNPTMKDWLLKKIYFSLNRLPELMDTKPIDEVALKKIIPTTWWESVDSNKGTVKTEGQNRKSYLTSCKKIYLGVKEIELLQVDFLERLLENKEESDSKASPRKVFLNMFRHFLRDNCISYRIIPIPAMTPLPVSLCYFHRLLSVLRRLWERELPHETPHVPVSKFYDTSINFLNLDRLGGTWMHLLKKYREVLASRLGEEHHLMKVAHTGVQTDTRPVRPLVMAPVQTTTSITSPTASNPGLPAYRIVGLTRTNPLRFLETFAMRSMEYKAAAPGAMKSSDSLMELLDGIIMFYHIAAHKQLQNISVIRESLDKYTAALNETQVKLNNANNIHPSAVNGLKYSEQVFNTKLEDLSRYMAWIRGVVYTSTKQADLIWLLQAMLTTLRKASRENEVFAFVPDYYIDSLVELSTALRSYFDPTVPLLEPGHVDLMVQIAEFLAVHFSDPRILNPATKDNMIQAIAGFMTTSNNVKFLESIGHDSQVKLISDLLEPYDNRPWGQSNWILLRMWQGCGFAFRYQKSPHYRRHMGPKLLSDQSLLIHQTFKPCPSVVYQNLVRDILLADEEVASAFINSVLNQLNWSFSEVIGMLQEIQNLSARPERVFIEAHQLKVCSTCFDFALGLLRVLEMVVNIAKPVCTDFTRLNSENLLERLCQLLCQILLRVSSVTGCFHHVVTLDIPDMEAIDPFPILAAVIGILVTLTRGDKSLEKENNELSPVVKVLLSEPAFQIKCLQFALGEDEDTIKLLKGKKEFTFLMYPEAVSETEIMEVREMISLLEKCMPKAMSSVKETPDEELCLICCAMPMSVILIPCLHKSCKSCISHFLLMNTKKKCFFCKTAITSVTDFSGTLLYTINVEYQSESEASSL